MRSIYFILTNTGTILSKIIRLYTKDEFAHVSIALDKELQEMYSFGRLNPYNPFVGGFVQEYVDKGTFKRFYNTKAMIYELEVEDEKYDKIKDIILEFKRKRETFKFNLIGLFAVGFNIKYTKDKSYYCAEFIKYITEQAEVDRTLPELIRPENFKNLQGGIEIYKGLLREYIPDKKKVKA